MRAGLVVLAVLLSRVAVADVYCLAVGIEDYRHPEITDVPFAVADAVEFRRALVAPAVAGIAPDHVVLLTSVDRAETAPTRANVLLALKRLGLRVTPADTLLFYFAGHGIETPEGQYLLALDSDPLLLEETAIPVSAVRRLLEEVPAATVVLLLDACRNDPYAARGDGPNVLTEDLARGLRPRRLAAEGGPGAVVSLLACGVGERAWGWPEQGHGVFTSYLLEGLRGAAMAPDGQTVRLDSLASYVQAGVASWAAARGRQQNPLYDNPSGVDLVLARPRPAARLAVTTEPAGATVFVDGLERGRSPCEIELDLGGQSERSVEVTAVLRGHAAARQQTLAAIGRTVAVSFVLDALETGPAPTTRPSGAGFLGVEIRDARTAGPSERERWPWLVGLEGGALVVALVEDSPAADRLRPGDVVLRCDGEAVTTAAQLRDMVRARRPLDAVRLQVLSRDGTRSVRIVLGVAP